MAWKIPRQQRFMGARTAMSEIYWIEGNPSAPLAIVQCPRGDDGLKTELIRIRQHGIETIVSLLEDREAMLLGLAKEGPLAKESGLLFLSYPIPDTHVPENIATFRRLVRGLADRLRGGESIGVHCRGSIGRSTVTVACTLIHLGWEPKVALAAIAVARGFDVPNTEEQKCWILTYEAQP